MPSVLFSPPSSSCDPAQGRTLNSRSGEPIPCYGEKIPCFAAEQGIASKALGLLREMAVNLVKMVKKGQKIAKFPVLFPVFRESGPKPTVEFGATSLRKPDKFAQIPAPEA